MSDQGDLAGRNELDAFWNEVQLLLRTDRFAGVRKAGVGIIVPEDVELARSSELLGNAPAPDDDGPELEAATRKCCFRVFPSGRRICVPC